MTNIWTESFTGTEYRPFRNQVHDNAESSTPAESRMYRGSFQRRIDDANGTRYFVNFDLFDFSCFNGGAQRISAEASFSVTDGINDTCRVIRSCDEAGSISEVEQFMETLWTTMGWGYYERNTYSA